MGCYNRYSKTNTPIEGKRPLMLIYLLATLWSHLKAPKHGMYTKTGLRGDLLVQVLVKITKI